MPFTATWMGQEIITLSKISQKDKDKHHTISFTCGVLKKITNQIIYKTEIDPQT